MSPSRRSSPPRRRRSSVPRAVTDPRLSSRSRLASLRRAFLALSLIALAGGCTSLPPRQPLPPEVLTARAELEARWQEFRDLRALTDITIRRSGRTDRLSGVLLLRAPASLRFEALTPFGPPILVVASDAQTVTLWDVAQERAYLARATPEATRRWLGLALGSEDLVALLAGYALPPRDPLSGTMVPPDDIGPSVAFETANASGWMRPPAMRGRSSGREALSRHARCSSPTACTCRPSTASSTSPWPTATLSEIAASTPRCSP